MLPAKHGIKLKGDHCGFWCHAWLAKRPNWYGLHAIISCSCLCDGIVCPCQKLKFFVLTVDQELAHIHRFSSFGEVHIYHSNLTGSTSPCSFWHKPRLKCFFKPRCWKSRRKPVIPVATEQNLFSTKYTSIYIICLNVSLFYKVYITL
jgi:hypothetical protein